MRKLKIVLILLCSIILFNCTQNTDLFTLKKGKAIVAGNVENWKQGSGVIRFASNGAVNGIEQTVIIDSLGNFQIEMDMYHPQNVNFFYEKGFAALYLKPSDSLYLILDSKLFKKDQFPMFNTSGLGKAVVISKNMNDYLRFHGSSSFNPDPQNKSVDEFIEVLKQEVLREDSILQVFCKANKTTPEFRNWAKNDNIYGVANYIISYRFANRGVDYKGNLFDKALFPVDNDAAIVTDLYGLHLRHYALNLGIWQDSVSMNLLENENFLAANIRCLNRIISKEKQGFSRDIMCYKIMLGLYDSSFEDFEIALKDVGSYIDNQTLKDILQEKKEDFISQKDINITFFDPKTKEEKAILGDFWAELSAKYIGKVVYVDIWATWCGPCKGEIPHAIDLQEFYKDKEIAFVNLCLSSDKSEWEKMIVNSNIHGDNYFFNKPQTQLVRDKLKFEGYPTYLIIDKTGNLINKNAPRPSSGDEIKGILNELIRR